MRAAVEERIWGVILEIMYFLHRVREGQVSLWKNRIMDQFLITVNFAGCPVVSILDLNTNLVLKSEIKGFRGGTMNKNLPDTAGGNGFDPCSGYVRGIKT